MSTECFKPGDLLRNESYPNSVYLVIGIGGSGVVSEHYKDKVALVLLFNGPMRPSERVVTRLVLCSTLPMPNGWTTQDSIKNAGFVKTGQLDFSKVVL